MALRPIYTANRHGSGVTEVTGISNADDQTVVVTLRPDLKPGDIQEVRSRMDGCVLPGLTLSAVVEGNSLRITRRGEDPRLVMAQILPFLVRNPFEDIETLRATAREFADAEVARFADEIDRVGVTPEWWRIIAEQGFTAVGIPEEFGGSGGTLLDQLVTIREISRASGSLGLSLGAHMNLVASSIARNGSRKQKERYLPGMCKGEVIGALCMTEEESGSDIIDAMKTRAVRDGDSWILNGSKTFITNAPEAQEGGVFIVYAKIQGWAGQDQVAAFLVDGKTPGITVSQPFRKMGNVGSHTCEVRFDNCRLGPEDVLGGSDKLDRGLDIFRTGLSSERIALTGCPLGLADAAMEDMLKFSATRKISGGRKLINSDVTRERLGDLESIRRVAEEFAYRVACSEVEGGKIDHSDAAASLHRATQAALEITRKNRELHGGSGYTRDYRAARLMLDAELWETGAGTTLIRKFLIAHDLVKNGVR